MAGPQAQRPISQHEGSSASRALRSIPLSTITASHSQHVGVGDSSGNGNRSDTSRIGTITAITTAPASTGSIHDQHIEISVDDEQNPDKDVEHGGRKLRHRSHHRRPLYRRVINYIRHAWTGVKFSSSNGNLFQSIISISVFFSIFFSEQFLSHFHFYVAKISC